MIKINNATTMKRSTGRVRLGVTARTTILKRSRPRPIVSPPSSPCSSSGTSSFDMRELFVASQQVEETDSIPAVESWAFFDDIDNDYDNDNNSDYHSHSPLSSIRTTAATTTQEKDEDEGEDDLTSPPRNNNKRHCRGLTRCHRSCNLISLSDMAILNTPSQRYGSNGSLS